MAHAPRPVATRQRGAALIIGLVLLMVLTLLAVSGMNSASLEFIMAGNEQYRSNAFQAAEVGVAQALAQGDFSANVVGPQPFAGATNGNDAWAATITMPVGTNTRQAPPNFSATGTFTGFYFEIASQGTSSRGATENSTQGLYVLAPGGQSWQKE